MPTPYDNPHILRQWEQLEEMLVSQLGRPRAVQRARRKIAKMYGVSYATVRDWLTVGTRKWILGHLDWYLFQEFSPEEVFTISDVNTRVSAATGKRLGERAVATAFLHYKSKFDNPPIHETGPNLYRLDLNYKDR